MKLIQTKFRKEITISLSVLIVLSSVFCIGQTVPAKLYELEKLSNGIPQNLTKTENGFYFSANNSEFWYSDGTIDGTILIKDFYNTDKIEQIIPVDNKVYFAANESKSGRSYYDLWVSDRTEEGTINLTNRDLGIQDNDIIQEVFEYNGKIFFSAFHETFGIEPWVTDGTVEGTMVLKDIAAGEDNSHPQGFMVFKDKLYFVANDKISGYEIWESDGTSEGTLRLTDINGGGSILSQDKTFLKLDNMFLFYAHHPDYGSELWKSNGTLEGTSLVSDIYEGKASSNSVFTGGVINGKAYFIANDNISGYEIWESDGTSEGTKLVEDLREGRDNTFAYNSGKLSFGKTKIYFIGYDEDIKPNLWAYDTLSETFSYLGNMSLSRDFYLDPSGEGIVFYGNNSVISGLWRSDGTQLGTNLITSEIRSSNTSTYDDSLIILEDKIFFSAKDSVNGVELWVSDLTNEGTNLFKDFNLTYSSSPSDFIEINDKVFFSASQGIRVYKKTNDSNSFIPVQVTGHGTDDPPFFLKFGNQLVFAGRTTKYGYELWISDGTLEGTKMIKDIWPGGSNGITKNDIVVLGNKIFFSANDGTNGYEIWISDGTEEGTKMIKDIVPGANNNGTAPYGSYPQQLMALNENVYFYGIHQDNSNNNSLFKTDGTEAGTQLLLEFYIRHMELVGDKIAIFGKDPESSTNSPYFLWYYDTVSGDFQNSNIMVSYDYQINSKVLNNELYFIGNKEGEQSYLYKTDGTLNGTIPIYQTSYKIITACGELIYLGTGNSWDTQILMRSDGTTEGTYILQDFGNSLGYTDIICVWDKLLLTQGSEAEPTTYFTSGNLNEIYEFDFEVINGEQLSLSARNYAGIDNKLFFSGKSEKSGFELYISTPSKISVSQDLVDTDDDGVVDFFDECPDTSQGLEVNEVGCAENQLDDDNDGVTNDLDLCPKTEEGLSVDENGCSQNQSPDNDDDGVLNLNDLCPETPPGKNVDENGCSESQLDEDKDGVFNDKDICPRTKQGINVDDNGCPIKFSLPSNNFEINTTGETCLDKNNGKLIIVAQDIQYNYSVNVNGETHRFISQLEILNLQAKTYNFCITIDSVPDYKQCFSVDVPQAESVSGKSTTLKLDQSFLEAIEIESGTLPYKAFVNGNEVLETSSSHFSVKVKEGDFIEVKSKFKCEGIYSKKIETTLTRAYPNPAVKSTNIVIGHSKNEKVEVFIYDMNHKLVSREKNRLNQGKMEVHLEMLPKGVYLIRVKVGAKFKTFKIVKS